MAMKVVLDLRWAELQVRVKHVGFQTHRRDLLREVLCHFVHMHTSTWDGVLRRAITVINLHDMLAPPQSGVLYWQCSSFVAKNSAEPVWRRPVKIVRHSFGLRCLGGVRVPFQYPVSFHSARMLLVWSVPASSIFSQRTYAAGTGLLLLHCCQLNFAGFVAGALLLWMRDPV